MKTLHTLALVFGATLALHAQGQTRTVVDVLHSVVQRATNSSADAEANGGETVPLTGKVMDAAGQPVAGAVVERYEYDWSQPYLPSELELRERVTTDSNGSFEFRVARTSMTLLAHKSGLAPAWRGWSPSRDTDLRLVLTPPTGLAGVVVDEADKPVAGAEVFVSAALSEIRREGSQQTFASLRGKQARGCFSTHTDVDGRFQIEGFPTNAAANLEVEAPGKALRQSRAPLLGMESMQCRAGDKDIRLVVEPTGSVEGRIVTEEAESALPVAQLWLEPDGAGYYVTEPRKAVQSRGDGSFLIKDVAAGPYRIRTVFGTNLVPEWVAERVPVTVQTGQPTRGVQVTAIRGGFLEVTVLGKKDRKPIEQVNVSASQLGFSAGARSGSNGVARLRLLPGDYRVSGFKENWRSETSSAVVEASKTNRVEIELAQPFKVTGVVRRPDGQPAAGLAVKIVGVSISSEAKIETDAQGRFELPMDAHLFGSINVLCSLLIRDPEHNLAVAQEFEEETGPLDLRLAPGLTIVGRAECNGKPLTNATASLVFWAGNRGLSLSGLSTGTNIPGHFEISALPPGRKYTLDVSAPGYGRVSVNEIDSSEAQRIELDPVELKPANLKLAGKVLDADDKPAAGAHVTLSGDGQPFATARTDREGRFSLDNVCEGQVQLSAYHMNVTGGVAVNSHGSTSAEAGDTNVVLKLGESSSSSVSSYSSSKSQRLKGVVTDPAGKPVAGAQVAVLPFSSSRVKTDANGTFNLAWTRMSVQSGGSSLIVRDTARDLAAAEEVPEETTNLNVQLKPALTLAGRVENPDGAPFTNAQVTVLLRANRFSSPVSDQPATTDASGRFRILALPADQEYTVYANAKGHSRRQQKVQVGSETNWVELEPFVLKVADKVMAGQVVNTDDKPASGVHVSLSGDDQPSDSATTDSKGRFRFQVCEGTVRLFASGSSGFASVSAEAGDTNVVVQLSRGPSITRQSVTRFSLKGKPLPDLAELGLAAETIPAARPLLLCLFDGEQRPSRRCVRLLAEQHEDLKQKGLTVLAIQSAPTTTIESWQSWKAENPVPFPVGCVTEKSDKTRWATGTASLPRLILTDAQGKVAADGFALEDLDTQLKALGK